MNEVEVNEYASQVLLGITSDLNENFYSDKEGELKFFWSQGAVNAWAESEYFESHKPIHKIVMTYELVNSLYLFSKAYQNFMIGNQDSEVFISLYENMSIKPRFPEFDIPEEGAKNMFLGAITWIYFHEFGHLNQEHGYIKQKLGNVGHSAVSFFEAYNDSGSASSEDFSMSHAFELAADFEATEYCITELARHFFTREEFLGESEISDESREQFLNAIFIFVSGLSCAMYLFYGSEKREKSKTPTGSHPDPLRRLGSAIPHLIERMDILRSFNPAMLSTSREDLSSLCFGASDSYGFFWNLVVETKDIESAVHTANDPFFVSYWSEIIKNWDLINAEVIGVRHFGSPLGVLRFSEHFRNRVFNSN